jgi:hypothetical protein
VGSVIAPADGPQRFPLGTAEKLRGAALDLVLGRFARRLRNLGISRAFDSWVERWRERTYAMARVRACTSRVALQQLADAFGFWARPPEWVWKSLEYDDEVRNQGRDTISHVDRKMCLGLCLIWMPRIVPYLDTSDCALFGYLGLCLTWMPRIVPYLDASVVPGRCARALPHCFVHRRRSPLPTLSPHAPCRCG